MKKRTVLQTPFYKKKSFWIAAVAALLAVAILLAALITALAAAPAVYTFDGATLREDVYGYWFACLKYIYQIRYKDLEIPDTPRGWQGLDADGRSYEEVFFELIDEEIRLRFVAATVFDAERYTLSDEAYEMLDALILEFKTETYDEVPFDVLKETYGVGKNAVKQTALYQQKYAALYETLFPNAQAIYAEEYGARLAAFYRDYYARYNMIYVADSAGEEHRLALEAALADGVTEEEFTELERVYTTGSGVTSGNYPGGIYLYRGEDYMDTFTPELLSAFAEADEVGKVAKKRSMSGSGTYYVMRYALDEEPYLSGNEKIRACFKELPDYAGPYLYRAMLKEEAEKLSSFGLAEGHTVSGTVSCKNYNMVHLLGD